MAGYDREAYWDKVAEEISSRNDLKIIAGDDEPYYRYKRKLFYSYSIPLIAAISQCWK